MSTSCSVVIWPLFIKGYFSAKFSLSCFLENQHTIWMSLQGLTSIEMSRIECQNRLNTLNYVLCELNFTKEK